MSLRGLHLLLTYRCTHACTHCFVHSGPTARGTFSRPDVVRILDQAAAVGTIEWIWVEGGEPFLHHPLLVATLGLARERGFRAGVVTNGYWAERPEDAVLWLRPLQEAGLEALAVSDDALHRVHADDDAAEHAVAAAERLGLATSVLRLATPDEGEGVRFRGRAAHELTAGRPGRAARTFDRCPDEDLVDPARVHVDAHGHVHLCQGLLLGNAWETPLPDLLAAWDPRAHPVVGPLLAGGPAALAEAHGVPLDGRHVSACHFCYDVRRSLLGTHDDLLGPPQVYGLADPGEPAPCQDDTAG